MDARTSTIEYLQARQATQTVGYPVAFSIAFTTDPAWLAIMAVNHPASALPNTARGSNTDALRRTKMDNRTRAFARAFAFVYQPIPTHLFTVTAWDHQIARDAWERLTQLARFYPYNTEHNVRA